MNVLDVVGTGLDVAQQAANVYDTFRGDRNSGSNGTVVNQNQNHYHITKSPEEIALEKERIELQRQRDSFNRATQLSQQAEALRTQRKMVDSLTDRGEDNTAIYLLGGIVLLGIVFTVLKSKNNGK